MPGHRPILGNEAGLTILGSGVIKIRESLTIADKVLRGVSINDPDRAKRVNVVYRHEAIHYLQTYMTAFVFAHCEEVRGLSAKTALWLSDKSRDFNKLDELRDSLTSLEDEMRKPTGHAPCAPDGVSALQLMEAAAVIESLRSLTDITYAQVLQEISADTDGDVTYTGVLKVAERNLGAEATVRLVPTLVFIALNTEVPGETFSTMLARLADRDSREVASLRPQDMFDEFMRDRSGTLISAFAKGQRPSKSPFWNDVGVAFGSSGDLDLLHLIAANPASLLSESNWSKQLDQDSLANCSPVLAIYEDGRGKLMGAGKDWAASQVTTLLVVTEILGVMYRIGLQRNYEVFCRHLDCPDRASALCHMAYPPAPSPDGDWKECPFRDRFKKLTGDWPAEFAKKCGIT